VKPCEDAREHVLRVKIRQLISGGPREFILYCARCDVHAAAWVELEVASGCFILGYVRGEHYMQSYRELAQELEILVSPLKASCEVP